MGMIVSGTVCLLFQMTFIFCVLSFSLTWAPYVLCYISARKRRCSFWTFLLFIVLEIWFKLASVYCCSVKYKQTLYLFVREENNLGLNDTCTCLDSQITSCCTALEYYNKFSKTRAMAADLRYIKNQIGYFCIHPSKCFCLCLKKLNSKIQQMQPK